jgi:2-iminobutanoate/2-iminopropanoate deaminase
MTTSPDSTDRRSFLANSAMLAIAGGTIGAAATNADAAPDDRSSTKRVIVPGSPSPAYSRATRLGNIVFVAGCVGVIQKDGKAVMPEDFEAQARQTLLNLKASVEAAGSSLDQVLKCNCFLKNYADFKQFNEIYMSIFPEPRPARSTVVVKDFVVPGALLEVDCTCAVAG